MRILLIYLFFPLLVTSQNTGVLVTGNSNSYLNFADSGIAPSKIATLATLLNAKQATLVSGTNIKTVNGR